MEDCFETQRSVRSPSVGLLLKERGTGVCPPDLFEVPWLGWRLGYLSRYFYSVVVVSSSHFFFGAAHLIFGANSRGHKLPLQPSQSLQERTFYLFIFIIYLFIYLERNTLALHSRDLENCILSMNCSFLRLASAVHVRFVRPPEQVNQKRGWKQSRAPGVYASGAYCAGKNRFMLLWGEKAALKFVIKPINHLSSIQSNKNCLILNVSSTVSPWFNVLTKEESGPIEALADPNAYSS